MNITTELVELYTIAKSAKNLDLSFRILAHFERIRPNDISLDMLSEDDLNRLIAQCEAIECDG